MTTNMKKSVKVSTTPVLYLPPIIYAKCYFSGRRSSIEMGYFSIEQKSIFDTLIEAVGLQDVDKFDYVKDIIVNTDLLEKDCADFMDPEFSYNISTLPIYEWCHEELLRIIWMTKYRIDCFLPEFWIFFNIQYKGKCYKCDYRAQLYDPESCKICNAEAGRLYYHDDRDMLEKFVNDNKNYCISCRTALYNIVDVYNFNGSICGCDY